MDEKECGFVLKRVGSSLTTFSFLTLQRGKITVFIKNMQVYRRLWPGMLVTLVTKKIDAVYEGSEIEIIAIPYLQSHDDIVWMHHLLELFYYFTPLEVPHHEPFELLQSYLTLLKAGHFFTEQMPLMKKICVLLFLQKTGLYEQQLPETLQFFSHVIQMAKHELLLDDVEKLKEGLRHLDALPVQELDAYILSCLKDHPSFNYFKTTSSLYDDGHKKTPVSRGL